MRRTDEWGRIVEKLPLDLVFQIDYRLLSDRLADIPDDANGILRLFDGHRTLGQVIEQVGRRDVTAARILHELFLEKIIRPVEGGRDRAPEPLDRSGEGEAAANGVPRRVDEWFTGPAGAEPPPVQPLVHEGDPGVDAAPRIVRFPPRRREARSPAPARGADAAPSPAAEPELPPPTSHVVGGAADAASPAHPDAHLDAVPDEQPVPLSEAPPGRRRSMTIALVVVGCVVAGAAIGVWKAVAIRAPSRGEGVAPSAPASISPPAPSASPVQPGAGPRSGERGRSGAR